MKKTILVTGGAGFIGSNFVSHLFKRYPDYRILVLDNLKTYKDPREVIPEEVIRSNRFEFRKGSITDEKLVDELMGRAHAVVHLAAESHVSRSIFDDSDFFETNVMGTRIIAHAVLHHKNIERLVHISTVEVYGSAEYTPMDEDHPLNPRSPYAASKAGADRLIYSYWHTHNLPAVILRPGNNYGPAQHTEKLIPRFITNAFQNEPLTIHGKGTAKRDWIYVGDTATAIDKVLHAPLGSVNRQAFNVSSDTPLSIEEIATKILAQLGKPEDLKTYVHDRPGQVELHYFDSSKIQKTLGWKPEMSFDEGLEETIKWYKENESVWRKQEGVKTVPITFEDGSVEWQ